MSGLKAWLFKSLIQRPTHFIPGLVITFRTYLTQGLKSCVRTEWPSQPDIPGVNGNQAGRLHSPWSWLVFLHLK